VPHMVINAPMTLLLVLGFLIFSTCLEMSAHVVSSLTPYLRHIREYVSCVEGSRCEIHIFHCGVSPMFSPMCHRKTRKRSPVRFHCRSPLLDSILPGQAPDLHVALEYLSHYRIRSIVSDGPGAPPHCRDGCCVRAHGVGLLW